MYQNERGVGEGIRASGLPREDVFVTSKLNNGFHRPADARSAFDQTLGRARLRLRRPVLDPLAASHLYDGDFVSTWQTLEEFRSQGRARSIGVSNFQVAHLERLAAETATVPAVNQIEVHPYLGNETVRSLRGRARDRHRGLVSDRPGWRAR